MPKLSKKISTNLKNLISAPKNLIFRTLGAPIKPRWLWFGVTNKCNSRCVFCDIWREKLMKEVLTPNEIEKALSDPLFRNVEYILNSGGEPTLRQDLKEVILAEHKALPNARIQLSTNALLPERVIDVVKFAVQHDINIDVGTSIDGIGEKHDQIRGVKGNFEKVDWLLRQLLILHEEYGDKISATFGFTLIDRTISSLQEVRAYAKSLNIEFLVQWYNQSSFYNNTENSLAINNESMAKAVMDALPCSLFREMWLRSLKGKSIKFPCFAMNTFCVLKCNGDIVPCLTKWDSTAGNVRQASPTEIWRSNQAKQVRGVVKRCEGCLNSWGAGWSFQSCYYQLLSYYLRHPKILSKKLIS